MLGGSAGAQVCEDWVNHRRLVDEDDDCEPRIGGDGLRRAPPAARAVGVSPAVPRGNVPQIREVGEQARDYTATCSYEKVGMPVRSVAGSGWRRLPGQFPAPFFASTSATI